MSRIAMIDRDEMTDDQRAACDEAVAGLRGTIPTPMVAWIRNSELARRAQRLGELLRYETLLEPRLSELAILVCARHWTSHVEWTAHKREALKAGVNLKTVDSIARRERPVFEAEDEAIVFDVSSSLLARGEIGQELYRIAEDRLGERRLVELVALVGYYSLVALTLNAFELGIPDKLAPELLEASEGKKGSR
jgi:4-carboxymuconolactone decarboxylase